MKNPLFLSFAPISILERHERDPLGCLRYPVSVKERPRGLDLSGSESRGCLCAFEIRPSYARLPRLVASASSTLLTLFFCLDVCGSGSDDRAGAVRVLEPHARFLTLAPPAPGAGFDLDDASFAVPETCHPYDFCRSSGPASRGLGVFCGILYLAGETLGLSFSFM